MFFFFFCQKCVLTQFFLKRLIFISEKATFFFGKFFPVVSRTWLELRSEFFWARNLGFRPKNPFLPYDPNFGQRPIFSPLRKGSFHTLGTVLRLFVPELRQLPKKKLDGRDKKIFSLPTVRALSASNSPSTLSVRAGQEILFVQKFKVYFRVTAI